MRKAGARPQGQDAADGRFAVTPRFHADLSEAELELCARVADRLAPEVRAEAERRYFGPHARQAVGAARLVFLGDVTEIPLLTCERAPGADYRLPMLAGQGDAVVIGGPRSPDFEHYVEKTLGLGRRSYLQVGDETGPGTEPVQVTCLRQPAAFAALRALVADAEAATLVPHLASATIWALARRLAREIGRPVDVAGPLPTICRLANNKLWFSGLARRLLGPNSLPHEVAVYSRSALVARVRDMSRSCAKLVIKLPDSAGSAGNFPVDASEVAGMSPKAVLALLTGRMAAAGIADGPFPLIVQVWEQAVLSSPSIQLWIPRQGDGPPIIEGVFEQRLAGAAGEFSGAATFTGTSGVTRQMCHQGAMLGRVLQRLGYFGRCSFDAILAGTEGNDWHLHWIECNGRWGGVSIPMSLVNRLFPGPAAQSYVIGHWADLELPRRRFSEAVARLDDLLWKPGKAGGVIFLTPCAIETSGSLQFVAVAATPAGAEALARNMLERLENDR